MSASASPATRLVALVGSEGLRVFHDADGELFARHGATAWALDDSTLADHLAALYHKHEDEVPAPSQLATAFRVLRGLAAEREGDEDDLAAAAAVVPPPPRGGAAEGSGQSVGAAPEQDTSLVGQPLAELLVRVAKLVAGFVVMSLDQAVTVALWVAHTHALAAADSTPYLFATSPEKRAGKTRLLEVLELLVARPLPAANISTAALAHLVQAEQPTLLLDEVDAVFRRNREQAEGAETLRGILNAGHRRGRPYVRMAGQGAAMVPVRMEVFCAKALAGIGSALPDTLADRTITIALRRKTRAEPAQRFRPARAEPQTEPVRVALAAWALVAVEELRGADPTLPEELDDRAQDCWEPLLGIADLAEAGWPARARKAALTLSAALEPEEDSLGVRLLADVRAVLHTERITGRVLVAALAALEDAPWRDLYGKGLTTRRLAELLRPFGIAPHNVRLADGTQAKGYRREQFEDAWSRYLQPEREGE